MRGSRQILAQKGKKLMTDRNHHPHITRDASARTSGVCSAASHGSCLELHLRREMGNARDRAAHAAARKPLLASQASAGRVQQQAVHMTWAQRLKAALPPLGAS